MPRMVSPRNWSIDAMRGAGGGAVGSRVMCGLLEDRSLGNGRPSLRVDAPGGGEGMAGPLRRGEPRRPVVLARMGEADPDGPVLSPLVDAPLDLALGLRGEGVDAPGPPGRIDPEGPLLDDFALAPDGVPLAGDGDRHGLDIVRA